MNLLLIIASIGFLPNSPVIEDHADVIEVNHYFDENGELVLEQVIFWLWHPGEGVFHVLDWRFKKSELQVPRREWHRDGYVTIWVDGVHLRRVRAPVFRETWYQFDPEVDNRRLLPQHMRRGLSHFSKPYDRR
jgi:hypothetical protein